jgi:hypothetical protein
MKALALGSLFLVACSSPLSDAETLDKTVMVYNQHLRWKRFSQAAVFLPDKQRAPFLKLHEPSEETLNVDDLEVKNIDWEKDGARAKVTVSVAFYKLPSVTLQKKKWVQIWERHGKDFWLMNDPKEPFFEEPETKTEATPEPR